jgi:HK97 family phage major capsid protein
MTTTTDTLTRSQAASRMQQIHERLTELSGKHRLSRADDLEFTESSSEFEALTRHVEKIDRLDAISGAARGGGGVFRLEGERHATTDPHAGRDAADERMAGGVRDSAMRQLERSVKAGALPSGSADAVERLCEDGHELQRSWMQRYVTFSGEQEYKSAFRKLLVHGEARAGLEFTAGERAAYDRVSRLKSEQRAMSLIDSAGGYLVPYEVDFNITITSGGSINPLLQWARVVHSVSDVWHGINSNGVVSSFVAESAEVSDGSPTLAEPAVPNYKASTFVPYSIEVAMDSVDLVPQLGQLISDSQTQLLNEKWTNGSGVGEPTGLITKLTGTSSVVNAGTPATIAARDVWDLQNSLPPRWQANAKWLGNLAAINAIAALETANGAIQFPSIQNEPRTLLGRQVGEASNMDGSLTAGTNALVYGDFRAGLVISQRIGTSIELVPHLFGPNRLPSGERALYAWSRWGSDCINTTAFKMLHV